MTQHDHSEYVPGCFRCDLSAHEAREVVLMSPKPRMDVSMTFRLHHTLRDAAKAKAEEREEDVSDVLREALEKYVKRKSDVAQVPIDPCPTCGAKVNTVTGAGDSRRYLARPCGHAVAVTMWPDRVELERR